MEAARIIKSMSILLSMGCLLFCSGCVSMLRIDGPYKGRVIDAQTGQPIEGAVAHGTWSRIHFVPTGSSSEYYDSYEVLTDKNGEFRIPGKGLLVFSNIDDMRLSIFKAGYTQFPTNSNWSSLVQFGPFDKFSMDEFGVGTFKLKKLTIEERRKNGGPTLPRGAHNKMRLLIIETNKEMIEIGFPKNTLIPVE